MASDLLLQKLAHHNPSGAADRLVAEGVLPRCYRDRYDERFLTGFRKTLELTRNLLVSDTPFLPDTISELAAHAILGRAREVLQARGDGDEAQATEVDPALMDEIRRQPDRLAAVLELLADTVFEDTDVLLLFELDDSGGLHHLRLRDEDRSALAFENWRQPFGEVPRPELDDDDGAWPVAI